ncbi:MAG: acylneuraminate cytidylyltransferase family protein [Saprospiraceae bacterium]
MAIIPARGGSKRLPHKNKKKLAGKELVRYAIEAAMGAKKITSIVVSSDDHDILEIAAEYPSIITVKRPEEISGDHAPAITYILHALEYMETKFIFNYDIIVIVQPSSPFTLGEDIDQTISLLEENKDADSSVSVMKLNHAIHPVKMKTMVRNVLIPYLEDEKGRMTSDELPELYVRNGSVYASRIRTIKDNQIIGEKCLAYVMPNERSIDINEMIDFEFAKFLMNKNG